MTRQPIESAGPRRLSLLYELFRASQASSGFMRRALADTGLSGEAYAIYSYLFANGPRTPSEAARDLGYPITTLASRLAPLVAAGDVTRTAHPLDRRAVLLELSARGHERLHEAIPRFSAAYTALLDTIVGMGTSQDELYAALETLRNAIESTARTLETEPSARLLPGELERRGR